MMTAISTAQKRKIYAVAREIGIDQDVLHAIVKERTKKEHISDLTCKEACRVIDYLENRNGRSKERSLDIPTGRQVALITPGQKYKIKELAGALGWNDNPKRLKGFCKKYTGVDNPDWITKEQAWRLIEGLKALLSRSPGGGKSGEFQSRRVDEGD